MPDRHQILKDIDFWVRLECAVAARLNESDDPILRYCWIDGFLPVSILDTKRGVDIHGTAWLGLGTQQYRYHFIVSIPQRMLHRRGQEFDIEDLTLDQSRQTLQLTVVSRPPVTN